VFVRKRKSWKEGLVVCLVQSQEEK